MMAALSYSVDAATGVRILSELEKAWLAGVIDGEGSILVSRIAPRKGHYRRGFYYSAKLEIANCNEAFLRKVADLIGKGSVCLIKEKRLLWRDRWQYTGSSIVLKGILPQVLPYLLVKRRVAEKMLEYLGFVDANPIDGPMKIPTGFDRKRDRLYSEIKRLNERGRTHSDRGPESTLGPPDTIRSRGVGIRVRNCRRLTEVERSWLAAIVDGEGSICLSKIRQARSRRGYFYCPKLEICNTNKDLLMMVWQKIGEGGVYLSKSGGNGWKARWAYCASAGVLRAILPQLLPYLMIKKAQAQKILEFFRYIDNNPIYGREVPGAYYRELDELYRAMKVLNQKGRKRRVRN
jgi:hypothetical protein